MMKNKFAINASVYTFTSVVSILLSFVTYPILTRNLSVYDYGLVNLLIAVSGLLIAIAKVGSAKSIVRFYHEEIDSGVDKKVFYSTVLFGVFISSLSVSVVYFLSIYLFDYVFNDYISNDLFPLLLLVTVLVITSSFFSGILNLLKAQENAIKQSLLQLMQKVLSVLLIFIIVVNYYQSALAVLSINILSELIIIIIVLYFLYRIKKISIDSYQKNLHIKMIKFGVPLIGWELSGLLLISSDKFVLNYFGGAETVAVYSAPYNLIFFIYTGAFLSIITASTPIATRYWNNDGRVKTEIFINQVKKIYILFAFPVSLGFVLTGKDLIFFLTSGKYGPDYTLLLLLMSAYFIRGYADIATFGLYINKKSSIQLKIISIAVLANILINILVIPKYGVNGAASSTLLSNFILLILLTKISYKYISQEFPTLDLIKAAISSSPMVLINFYYSGSEISILSIKIFLSALSYVFVLYILDSAFRYKLKSIILKS